MGSQVARKLSSKGQVLLLVLVLTFVAATLSFSLTVWSQEAHLLAMRSTADLSRTRLTMGISQQLIDELSQRPGRTLSDSSTYQLPGRTVQAKVDWNEEQQKPLPKGLSSGSALFSKDHTPSFAYGKSGGIPDWHSYARVQLPGGHRRTIGLRKGLPFAASAPWGSVNVAGRLDSWNNAKFGEESAGTVAPAPVRVQAYENLTLEGSFDYGLATSEHGRVILPDTGTGTGVNRYPVQNDAVDALVASVESAYEKLEAGTLNKRDFITGEILDPMDFFKLLTGKANLTMIFSLQQQCNLPLPMVPSIYNFDLLEVIALHNPYPSDFNGKLFTMHSLQNVLKDLLKSMFDAKQKFKDAKKVVKNAAHALAHIGHAIWDAIRGKIKRAKRELSRAKKDMEKAAKAFLDAWLGLDSFFDPFRAILKGTGDLGPQVPHTLSEEEEIVTKGFAYFSVLRRIEGSLRSFFRGIFSGNFNDLIYDLSNPTRVVHFTDRAPYRGFSDDGGFTLAWTMNVPRGRTLKIGPQGGARSADFVILGDLWLQRGATMVVDGNLFLRAPEQDIWLYRCDDDEGPDFRPTGTIYLEEGATLVVSGNLYAEGQGSQRPSLVVCSDYGHTPAINTAVICKGDVRLPGGVGPGVTLESLLLKLTQDLPVAGDLSKYLVTPLLHDVAPHLAKVLGPFNKRDCWFADYATTLVMIPELVEFGLQGPWPIPITYSNCMVNVFNPLTKVSAITLNFSLGDNLMTHCSWWIVGEGIVPVLPKVRADAYVEAAKSELEAELESLIPKLKLLELKFDPDEILKDVERQVENLIPNIVEYLINDVVQVVIREIMGVIPGVDDPCKDCEESDEEEEQNSTLEKLRSIGETTQGILETTFEAFISKAVETSRANIGEEIGPDALREVAGTLVYSGGKLTVGGGEEYPPSAVGLFVAQGDLEIQARHTIGAVSSRTGDIDVQGDLHFNPYFTQAFLYDPQDPDTYYGGGRPPKWLEGFEVIFRDAAYLKTPDGGEALDLTTNSAVITGIGRTSP